MLSNLLRLGFPEVPNKTLSGYKESLVTECFFLPVTNRSAFSLSQMTDLTYYSDMILLIVTNLHICEMQLEVIYCLMFQC